MKLICRLKRLFRLYLIVISEFFFIFIAGLFLMLS